MTRFLESVELTNGFSFSLEAFLEQHCTSADMSGEKPIHATDVHFTTFKLYFKLFFPAVEGKKERVEEGGFRSLSNLAGSGKTTELAAFKLKSCSHPLCCKIRFLLFSEGCRPWKHPLLSRSTEPASSRSAGEGTISQPPLRTHMARVRN